MTLTGVWLNAGGVLLAGVLGSFIRRGMPEKLKAALMTGLGLCVLYIGISGISADTDTVVLVLSVSLGMALGTALDLDGKLSRLGELIQQKLPLRDSQAADGFVSSTLFVCVGAMSIVGALNEGLTGNNEVLLVKSTLDFVTCLVLASSLGIGVAFAAVPTLIYQGAITLCAGFLAPYISDDLLNMICMVGYAIVICIGLNLLMNAKIKTANLLPAMIVPVLNNLLNMLKIL